MIRDFQNGNLNARIQVDSKGELLEFANSFNDMADTIVDNINQIKRMDTIRRDLVANVSHDLRTPLAIIRGYIETVLIKDESLSPDERKKYLETILSSTDRLLFLVEELFELSKLEAKETLPNKEVLSLAELMQDIHQKNLIIAKSKNIKLTLNIEENMPLIKADIGMMEKVFQNLLDNALKFTPAEGEINMSLEHTANNGRKLKAVISDSGAGIKQEELAYIFDRYYQIKRVSSENGKGAGLGLAIVKKILDLHDVKVDVKSDPGKGTKFILVFPV